MTRYKYGVPEKVAFYASYLWYKTILPLEVKSPRLAMWRYELAYTAHKFRDYEYCHPWKSSTDVIVTRFGAFHIRGGTADAANVSPAFERRDLNRLFSVVKKLVESGKRVLFLDIGGDIGTYAVAVARRFRSAAVNVVCFEPVPASCDLIRDNLQRNHLNDEVELMEVALMDEQSNDLKICLNQLAPGSSSIKGEGEEIRIQADRLDHLIQERIGEFDAVVMKIDVEGVEESVLRGAGSMFEQGVETHLMVEDFIDRSIIDYLEGNGWLFECKRTEYNSWWKKN